MKTPLEEMFDELGLTGNYPTHSANSIALPYQKVCYYLAHSKPTNLSARLHFPLISFAKKKLTLQYMSIQYF